MSTSSSSSSSSSSSHPLDPSPSPPALRDPARVDSPLHTTININPSPPNDDDDGQGQGLQHHPPSRPRQPSYETRGYSVDSFTSSSSTGARPSSSSSTMSSDAATITPMLPHHRPSSSSINLPRRGSSGSVSRDEEGGEELDTNNTGQRDSRLRWEDSWSEEDDEDSIVGDDDSPLDSPSPSSSLTETPSARRERRRRERRIFGGAASGHRHGSRGQELEEEENEEGGERGGGDKGVGEVAGLVLGGSLSPMPLLLPLACARLGPGLFVPLLALAGALGWLSAVVIGAEGRYVGARSFPALASAVFPHRLKLHLLGESLTVLFVFGGSIVRTTLDVVAAAEVAVDLFVPERRRRDWEREVGVGVICAVWLLVPLLVPPLLRLLSLDLFWASLTSSSSSPSSPPTRYSRLASTSSPDLSSSPYPSYSSGPSSPPPRARWTALLRLPAWSVALITWPLALLILGVRLKRLNRDASHSTSSLTLSASSSLSSFSSLEDLSKLPSHLFPNPTDPLTNQTLWPAILLPFSALLGAAHETFFYFTSLARPSSTATARRRGGGGRGGGRQMSFSGELPGEGTAATGGAGRRDEGRRNQYPLALAIGLFGSFLIHLGWALVGALGPRVPGGGGGEGASWLPAGNFLSDPHLPRNDFWINLSRLLVLSGILSQLSQHARLGIGRGRRALAFFVKPKGGANARAGEGVRGWRGVVARVGVWAMVAGLGWLVVSIPRIAGAGGGGNEGGGGGQGGGRGGEVGGHGSGLVYAVQWWAVVGGGLGACLGPALAYLTLFHLRPPRQIFLSPSTTNLSSTTGTSALPLSSSLSSSSSSSSAAQVDALLLRKERSIQRKLSGRRVWTDVGVFGALGPVGVVLVGRGVWALVSG